MRGDDAVAVLGRLRGAGAAALVGLVDGGALLVGGVAGAVEAELVDAVLAVAAGGVAGRREAPVAVVGLVHPVLDLAPHEERVVAAPRPRAPRLLGHEQRHHQRLEHAAAPGRHDVHAAVGQRALEDADAVVLLPRPDRLGLGPGPVAVVVGEGAERAVVVLGRDLAGRDAEVRRHPRLGVERAVVVAGVPDVGAHAAVVAGDRRRSRAGSRPRSRRGSGRPGPRPRCSSSRSPSTSRSSSASSASDGIGARGEQQAGGEPGVVDAGEERLDGAAVLGPDPELLEGGRVVPVVEHARRLVALELRDRGDRPRHPLSSPRRRRSGRCRGRRRCSTGRRRCWSARCTRCGWPGARSPPMLSAGSPVAGTVMASMDRQVSAAYFISSLR